MKKNIFILLKEELALMATPMIIRRNIVFWVVVLCIGIIGEWHIDLDVFYACVLSLISINVVILIFSRYVKGKGGKKSKIEQEETIQDGNHTDIISLNYEHNLKKLDAFKLNRLFLGENNLFIGESNFININKRGRDLFKLINLKDEIEWNYFKRMLSQDSFHAYLSSLRLQNENINRLKAPTYDKELFLVREKLQNVETELNRVLEELKRVQEKLEIQSKEIAEERLYHSLLYKKDDEIEGLNNIIADKESYIKFIDENPESYDINGYIEVFGEKYPLTLTREQINEVFGSTVLDLVDDINKN